MKQDTIEQLLTRYQEGTLTDGERAELEMLTHKEAVTSTAFSRAGAIIRRRRAGMLAFVLVGGIVLGAGVWMTDGGAERQELTAKAVQVPDAATSEDPRQEVLLSAGNEGVEEVQESASAKREMKSAVTKKSQAVAHTAAPAKGKEKPVVVCNSQCDADEVIDDIWDFLSA